MKSVFNQLNQGIDLKQIFTSFYKNNLISLSAESNGYNVGRVIIDLDESKKGFSHQYIHNYLINVRKKNQILVNKQYKLEQSQLQSNYDVIFQSTIKYFANELITVEQLLKEQSKINGANLVLVEDGTIQFLYNEQQVEELKKSQKKIAYIGKVINVQGNDILKELQETNQIVLKDLVSYKEVLLKKFLLFLSGCIGCSIITDIYSKELKMNLLNPLIKNESEYQYIFQSSLVPASAAAGQTANTENIKK